MSIDLDLSIMASEFVRAHPAVVGAFIPFSKFYSLKTMPIVALLAAIALQPSREARRATMCGILGCLLSLAICRVIQDIGPMRPRPLAFLEFGTGDIFHNLKDWSSFPSDTMGALAALSTAIFLASRRLGILAFLWTICLVGTAKFITGQHFVLDLIGGLAIGCSCTLLARLAFTLPITRKLETPSLSARFPLAYPALAFMLLFQISTFFDDVRIMGSKALRSTGVVKELALSQDAEQAAQ